MSPNTDSPRGRALLVGAFVALVAVLSATLFFLPLGFGFRESVVLGVFAAVAVFVGTVLDDATFGADE